MALNEVFKHGKSISLPVPSGTKSGDPVRVGSLNGVAIVDEGSGFNQPGYASVDLFGGHLFELKGAKVGAPVYFANGKLSLTKGDGHLWGAVTHLHRDDQAVVLVQSISV